MENKKESCNKRIKQAMELRNMNQADLVNATGIGKSAISQYLSGKYVPKQTATHAIAKALNVSEAWLMGYDVPITRAEEIKTAVTKEEKAFLDLFNCLDAADKENLKNYINNVLLVADKYDVKKRIIKRIGNVIYFDFKKDD